MHYIVVQILRNNQASSFSSNGRSRYCYRADHPKACLSMIFICLMLVCREFRVSSASSFVGHVTLYNGFHGRDRMNDVSLKAEKSCWKENNGRKWITGRVSLPLPFSAEIAFDTFSDLTRQPEWSPWLSAVEYLKKKEVHDLPETKWYLRGPGLRFSWKAVSTINDRPNKIGWESTSGKSQIFV